MKKLNVSLMAIRVMIALATQTGLFAMVPQPIGPAQNTPQFQYIGQGNNLRKEIATGTLQMRTGSQWQLADRTWSNNYQWVNITKPEEPEPTMNLESISDENND